MKSKILTSFLFAAFALVFSISMISAVVLTQSVNSVDYTSALTGTITVSTTPTILNDLAVNIAPTPSIAGNIITFSTASTTFDSLTTGKTYSGSYILTNTTVNETVTLQFVKSFCTLGALNNTGQSLEVDITNDAEGDGDEDTWYPRDKISVEVDFINDGTEDLDSVVIELGLVKQSSGANIAEKKLDWSSTSDEAKKVGDVDADDDANHIFEFTVPNDLDEGTYSLMIKAYPKEEESVTCLDSSTDLESTYYKTISIKRESEDERQVIFENIVTEPTTSPCGQEVTISAKMYNIGEEDQDAVKVFLYNKELGVDLNEVVTKFKQDDYQTVEFTFTVPATASEKYNTFSLFAKYGYDKDDDEDKEYVNTAFSDESSTYKAYLTTQGQCAGSIVKGASINEQKIISLNSEVRAIAGKTAVYQIPIENTGNAGTTYTITVSGVDAWASAEADPKTITIATGESANVEVILDIDSDAELGEKTFTVNVAYDSESIKQSVLVEVEQAGFLSSLTGNAIFDNAKSNWFIWTIVLVDIILIVAIFIAVKRMFAGKSA